MEKIQEIEAILDKIYNLAEEGISKATKENKHELKTLFLDIMTVADADKKDALKSA